MSIYTDARLIGSGTYGMVFRAVDENGDYVAIKQNLLDPATDFIGSIKEADILVRLRGHPNIVTLKSISYGCPLDTSTVPARKGTDTKDDVLYFVMEYVSYDLEQMIRSYYDWSKIGNYICQLLLGVEYIHRHGLIHRDIKPSNILWDRKTNRLKFCDFGMSRNYDRQGRMSPRVVTCWYRAPEICQQQQYDFASDMWSIGLVIMEMVTRQPILCKVKDNDHVILNVIHNKFNNLTCDKMLSLLSLDRNHPLFSWEPAYRKSFLELLVGLVQIDPTKRWSATKALSSRFFLPYANLINETRKIEPRQQIDTIPIVPGQPREWGMCIAYTIFNNRKELSWYSPQILFTAIDLYDRYLEWSTNQREQIDNTNEQLMYEIRFMLCLYLSMKYHMTLVAPPSFFDLVLPDKLKKLTDNPNEFLANIEKKLVIDVFQYHIYHPTVLSESANKLSDGDVKRLLIQLGEMTGPYRVTDLYIKSKE